MKQRKNGQTLNRQDNPPPSGPHLLIRRILPGEQPVLTILSPSIEGYFCHWVHDHTEPCIKGDQLCRHCLAQGPIKWYGFIHVFEPSLNEHGLVMITSLGGERLLKIKGDRETLRGLIVVCSRQKKSEKSPLVFTSKGEVPSYSILPPARPAEPTLRRIWKFSDQG